MPRAIGMPVLKEKKYLEAMASPRIDGKTDFDPWIF